MTSIGAGKRVGKTDSVLFKTIKTNDEFGLIGFFGSSDDVTIYSLGAIRMKYDCSSFAEPPIVLEEST